MIIMIYATDYMIVTVSKRPIYSIRRLHETMSIEVVLVVVILLVSEMGDVM